MNDDATAPHAAEPKATRKKDPRYVVLREVKVDDRKLLELLTPKPIKAANRKAAVSATAKESPVDGLSSYHPITEKEWQTIKHRSTTQTVDEFA